MGASSIARALLLLAGVPLVGACFDYNWVDDCHHTLTCPPPAPAAAPSDACEGTCVPGNVSKHWTSVPGPVWLGDPRKQVPSCTGQAPNQTYYGEPLPPAPSCGACSCSPPSGSCELPTKATASTAICAGAGTGVFFNAPDAWDGSCTTDNAVLGGAQSVTVDPLILTEEKCVPQMLVPKDNTKAWGAVLACDGNVDGRCPDPGDVCVPKKPRSDSTQAPGIWTYCLSHDGDGDGWACPDEYPNLRVFASSYTDTRTCAPCTCDPPEGSTCSSTITIYADDTCSTAIGDIIASEEGPLCRDIPGGGSSLGSKAATPPVYQPGSCTPSGGVAGTLIPNQELAFCCKD